MKQSDLTAVRKQIVFNTRALLLIVGVYCSQRFAASATQSIRIDGAIFDSGGVPLSGNRDVRIDAYDAASAGSLLWQSAVSNVSVTSGRFSLILDASSGSPSLVSRLSSLADGSGIYFEIVYDTGTADGSMDTPVSVTPRIRSKGSVFALASEVADSLSGVTATASELNYLAGSTANIQTQLNAKLTSADISGKLDKAGDTMTGDLGLAGSQATASRALILDSQRRVASSSVTDTELAYLSGVTSALATKVNAFTNAEAGYLAGSTANIQTQLNAKLDRTGDTMTGDLGLAGSQATASRALILDSQRRVASSSVTNTELASLSGVTSAIGDKLNPVSAAELATLSGLTSSVGTRLNGVTVNLTTMANALQGVTGTVLDDYLAGLTANVQTQINSLAPMNTTIITSSTQAASGNIYITNSASLLDVTLPSTCTVGDRFKVVGLGSGGWRINQNASQYIDYAGSGDSTSSGSTTTTGTGGYLQSINDKASVELICRIANTNWQVVGSDGEYTGNYTASGVTVTSAGPGSVTVATNVRSVTILAWGGGGGGGGTGSSSGVGGAGGGGAYVTSTISVKPGDILNYVVGSGGSAGGTPSSGGGVGGSGGGHTAVWRNGSELIAIAGGGGGGGGGAKSVGNTGGAGAPGNSPTATSGQGGNGTTAAGGYSGTVHGAGVGGSYNTTDNNIYPGSTGTYMCGGHGSTAQQNTWSDASPAITTYGCGGIGMPARNGYAGGAGGGGGGFFGGGGGGGDQNGNNGNAGAAGGGGSSRGQSGSSGSGTTPGNSGQAAGAATGGSAGSTGGAGRLLIYW